MSEGAFGTTERTAGQVGLPARINRATIVVRVSALTRSFLDAVAGIAASYALDTVPSGTIVLVAVAAYLISDAFRLARRSLARGRVAT